MRVSDVASKVAYKRLSSVDLPNSGSNQHEFNGVAALKEIFGTTYRKFPARIIWAPEDLDDMQEARTSLTWYDARERIPNRSEYRLYYESKHAAILEKAQVGDSLFIVETHENELILIVSPKDSTTTQTLNWFFQTTSPLERFQLETSLNSKADRATFLAITFFERLGFVLPKATVSFAEKVNLKFPDPYKWPKGIELAEFAWEIAVNIDPVNDPDFALTEWVNIEYLAYKELETRWLEPEIRKLLLPGGAVDISLFRSLAHSTLNRAKSRAGFSLERHMERILTLNSIRFTSQGKTEAKKRPDFLFPSNEDYHDPVFPPEKLFMLAAKRTLKDRWRQVLSEADRIPFKHLLTLDPLLTNDQLTEMSLANVTLVVPTTLETTYDKATRGSMLSVKAFISLMANEQGTPSTIK